ncbi:MAG: hypothetical protein KGI60_03275 [Patescibacteria group bacterium]|nr:hypothetical protein [Patescibacteria group bacterium]
MLSSTQSYLYSAEVRKESKMPTKRELRETRKNRLRELKRVKAARLGERTAVLSTAADADPSDRWFGWAFRHPPLRVDTRRTPYRKPNK